MPGWDHAAERASRAFGDCWYGQARTAVPLVPSVITRLERNIVINQAHHPDFKKLLATAPKPVIWDKPLFRR